ncbi:MAG: PIN domain-containing protein [Phycisphaerales bacterium]|nr:PIN domain-containing protein [Phycisphaerales bacterium]
MADRGATSMVLHILRALFILLISAVGYFFTTQPRDFWGNATWLALPVSLVLGVLLVCIDILSPRKKLAIFSGTLFGLVVGVAIAYALSFVVRLLVEQWQPSANLRNDPKAIAQFIANRDGMREYINMLVGVISCYLSISFILQTKDDFRFVIPYVEFSKQTKGARPMLLDTSVLIDGRINDVAATGILESQLIVPRFVLHELQAVADSSDKLKRNRGRRGLDMLAKLQGTEHADVILYDSHTREESTEVDQRLVALAKELNGRILTNDFNLNKVAQLRGVDVVNINDLANALKPVVLPGERMMVRLVKPGETPGQGVGYMEDGTMVVVEQGRNHLNEEVEFVVTSALQTSAGRMIFGRMPDSPAPAGSTGGVRKPRSKHDGSFGA